MKRKGTSKGTPTKRRVRRTDGAQTEGTRTGELSDDMLYEVLEWIPGTFLIANCTRICKQWKSIIEERSNIRLSINEEQWKDFTSTLAKPPGRIDELRIISRGFTGSFLAGRYRDRYSEDTITRIEADHLSRMGDVAQLSFEGCYLSDALILKLAERDSLKKISILDRCVVNFGSLTFLAQSESLESISLGEIYSTSPITGTPLTTPIFSLNASNSEERIRLISVLSNLNEIHLSLHWSVEEGNKIAWNKCLTECPSLRKLSITAGGLLVDYLPRMKNLTTISIADKETREECISCLADLPHLREVSLYMDEGKKITEVLGSKPLTCLTLTCRSGRIGSWQLGCFDRLTKLVATGINMQEGDHLPTERLTYLDLKESLISSEALTDIANMRNLTYLDVREVDKGVVDLSGKRLHRGGYDSCFVGISDLVYKKSNRTRLSNLTNLSVTLPISDYEDALDGLGCISTLEELHIERVDRSHATTTKAYMKEIKSLSSLTCLSISKIRLTGAWTKSIPTMKLKRLVLYDTLVKGEHLSAISGMSELRELAIVSDNLSDDALCKLSLIKQISHLDLSETQIASFLPTYIKDMSGLKTLIIDRNVELLPIKHPDNWTMFGVLMRADKMDPWMYRIRIVRF